MFKQFSIQFAGCVVSLFASTCWSQTATEPKGSVPADAQALAQVVYTPLPTINADGTTMPSAPIHVAAIPDSLREEYRVDPFYKKYTIILGIPIIGSEHVSDWAFLECAWTLDHLLNGRTMAHEALLKSKVRVGIIAVTEYTMDIPENQEPWMVARGAYNDRRSRGLGGLP